MLRYLEIKAQKPHEEFICQLGILAVCVPTPKGAGINGLWLLVLWNCRPLRCVMNKDHTAETHTNLGWSGLFAVSFCAGLNEVYKLTLDLEMYKVQRQLNSVRGKLLRELVQRSHCISSACVGAAWVGGGQMLRNEDSRSMEVWIVVTVRIQTQDNILIHIISTQSTRDTLTGLWIILANPPDFCGRLLISLPSPGFLPGSYFSRISPDFGQNQIYSGLFPLGL